MSPPVVAGKYQLLRKLGAGGMAEVFLAKQSGLDGFEKLVVIKRILPLLIENDEFVTMFLDEARTAADLRHPNVVNIFEVGEDAGTYYMAMEFLHGQDIRRVQRKVGSRGENLPLGHACQLVLDAAAGLHYAHTKADLRGNALNIIHRDVSPQNILVTYDGATKIVDFGIAKAASQDTHTATGIIKGKYTYMSPEQAQGAVIDSRSDQYALGIVFWELLTMRRLFKRESELQTLNAVISGEVPSPRLYAPDLPEHVEHIVLQCLAKDPADRFDSCEDLMLELEDFLADAGIVHSPARLGHYMRALFADTLAEEATLGAGLLEADERGASLASGDATQRGRRGTSKSRARSVRLDVADTSKPDASEPDASEPNASEPDAKTVSPVSHRSMTAVARDEHADASEPTGAMGDVLSAEEATMTSLVPCEGTSAEWEAPQPSAVASRARAKAPSRAPLLAAIAGGLGLGLLVLLAVILRGSEDQGGKLTVHSTPMNAQVILDGQDMQRRTPAVLEGVALGAHEVRLVLDGHVPYVTRVELEGAVTVQADLVASPIAPARAPSKTKAGGVAGQGLGPKGSSPRASAVGPEAEPPTRDGRKARKGRHRRGGDKARAARLRIVLKPWGEVFVDGRKQGITPMKPLTLPPGTYKVRLRNPELGVDVAETITLGAGEDKLIKKSW